MLKDKPKASPIDKMCGLLSFLGEFIDHEKCNLVTNAASIWSVTSPSVVAEFNGTVDNFELDLVYKPLIKKTPNKQTKNWPFSR